MAESKNTFVKSKMNKDLDDRLVPPGEYRDAKNIGISRSEDADVGAIENILGNISISDFGLGGGFNTEDANGEIIGYYMDVVNDRVFAFMTNYTDNSASSLDNFASFAAKCYIGVYNIVTKDSNILVQGRFLNFSTTHPINNVNLLENLLFWTDNRNQPRKINVELSVKSAFRKNLFPTYYTNEDQISVAKYYPHKVIDLIEDVSGTFTSTMQDVVSEYLPTVTTNGLIFEPGSISCTPTVAVHPCTDPCSGKYRTPADESIPFLIGGVATTALTGAGSGLTVSFNLYQTTGGCTDDPDCIGRLDTDSLRIDNPGEDYLNNDLLEVSYVDTNEDGVNPCPWTHTFQCKYVGASSASNNPDYNDLWPGDPTYLKDKFLRFSYRFKFEDGEYSLMAPFTQIAFIPEQDGYFLENDENRGYQATELTWFQNKVNNINLLIPAPNGMTFKAATGLSNGLYNSLKVIEIDILAKESNSLAVKVLDTIDKTTFEYEAATPGTNPIANTTSIYKYNYQSRKAYKTLPEKDTIRVYDKTPVRALTQEVVGNRVVYGNYMDKHTPPSNLDYNITINEKQPPSENIFIPSYNIKEYPNHTLKQNRTYQIGVILSDRYGRQSSVILSSVDDGATIGNIMMQGSTLYHDYRTEDIIKPILDPTYSWPGDALNIMFNNYITSGILTQGASSVQGAYFDRIYRKNISTGEPGLYDADTNPLGWYSYKIVVKQQEQDYYNVFFPGILNGTYNPNIAAANPPPVRGKESTPTKPSGYITLAGDNINKVPRGLTNVGPNQKIFRTSKPTMVENPLWYSAVDKLGDFVTVKFDNWDSPEAKAYTLQRNIELGITEPTTVENASIGLYPRVQNIRNLVTGYENRQSFPNRVADTVVSIATCKDIGLCGDMSTRIPDEFFNPVSDPLMARVEFQNFGIGVSCDDPNTIDQYAPKRPIFAVYETQPDISRLKLFWETSTTGIISELNQSIYDGAQYLPDHFYNLNFISKRENDPGSEADGVSTIDAAWTSNFGVENAAGGGLMTTADIILTSVTDADGDPLLDSFGIESLGGGLHYIYQKEHIWYGNRSQDRTLTFTMYAYDQGIGTILQADHTFGNVYPTAGYYIMDDITPAGDTIESAADAYANNQCFNSDEWTLTGNTSADPFNRFVENETYWAPLLAANGTYIDQEYADTPAAISPSILSWNEDNFPRAHNELEIKVISQTRYSDFGSGNSLGEEVAFFYIDPLFKQGPGSNSAYPYAWLMSNFTLGIEGDESSTDLVSGEIFEIKVEWRDCNGFTLNPPYTDPVTNLTTFPLDTSTTFGANYGLTSEYGFNQATFYCKPEAKFRVEAGNEESRSLMWLDEIACGSEAAKTLGFNWSNNRTTIVQFGKEWPNPPNLDVGSDVSDLTSTDEAPGVFTAPTTGTYRFKSKIDLKAGWKPNGMAFDPNKWSDSIGASATLGLDLCSGDFNYTMYNGSTLLISGLPIQWPNFDKGELREINFHSGGLVYGQVVMYKAAPGFDSHLVNGTANTGPGLAPGRYTLNDENFFDGNSQLMPIQSHDFIHNYNSGALSNKPGSNYIDSWDRMIEASGSSKWGSGCDANNIANGPSTSSNVDGNHNSSGINYVDNKDDEWWDVNGMTYPEIFTTDSGGGGQQGTPGTRRSIGGSGIYDPLGADDFFQGAANRRTNTNPNIASGNIFEFDKEVTLQAGEKIFIAVYASYNPGLGNYDELALTYPMNGITGHFTSPGFGNIGQGWPDFKYPNQLSMWSMWTKTKSVDVTLFNDFPTPCGYHWPPFTTPHTQCVCGPKCVLPVFGEVICAREECLFGICVCVPNLCTCNMNITLPMPLFPGISFPARNKNTDRVQGVGGSVYLSTNEGSYFEGELIHQ